LKETKEKFQEPEEHKKLMLSWKQRTGGFLRREGLPVAVEARGEEED
jgi:hypothetical protein